MLLQLFLSFAKIGAFSFGGGYAMIPLIEDEIVIREGWLSMPEFIDVIALSQATPGPIGINSATYVGYRMGGFWGSLCATVGVMVPSLIIMLALGYLYYRYRSVPFVRDVMRGVRPVVAALVLAAAAGVASATLTGVVPVLVASAVLVAITRFNVDPVLLLLACGVLGYFLYA